jgi:hypothetical protein
MSVRLVANVVDSEAVTTGSEVADVPYVVV